ncbi:MAG: GTPase Era [Clostridia bacterium]|nr:GTPase Era [Clostridia bacterium]
MKSGFIGIIGQPNVGKSSLMNRLIGEKISIVTPKPQTTRDAVRGILTTDEYQMVFVDTPGILTPKTALGKYMSKETDSGAKDVDVLVIVIDGSRRFTQRDFDFIENKLRLRIPTYVVVNKTDLAKYERIYPILVKLSPLTVSADDRGAIKEIVPTSCVNGLNVEVLKGMLASELTDEIIYYPEGDLTDRSLRFVVGEIIREKSLLLLQDEIPHGIGIVINKFDEKKESVYIEADVVCEKESHKLIIIGEKGSMIKRIGETARRSIEGRTGKRVFLKLFVKVREDWRNKRNYLRDLGYES